MQAPPTQVDLKDLPVEMVYSIFEYINVRGLVNLMSMGSFLRFLSVRFLVMGNSRQTKEKEMIEHRFRNDSVCTCRHKFTWENLNYFLDVLIAEKQKDRFQFCDLERMDLTQFRLDDTKVISKVIQVITLYEVEELIVDHSQPIDSYLKHLPVKKLKFTDEDDQVYRKDSSFYFVENDALTILDGWVTQDVTTLSPSLCENLRVLRVFLVGFKDSTLRYMLKNMKHLKELYLDFAKYHADPVVITLDEELKTLCEDSKLEILKIGSASKYILEFKFDYTLDERCMVQSFPKLKELQLRFHTMAYRTQKPDPHENLSILFFIPNHPLTNLSITSYQMQSCFDLMVTKCHEVDQISIFESANGVFDFKSVSLTNLTKMSLYSTTLSSNIISKFQYFENLTELLLYGVAVTQYESSEEHLNYLKLQSLSLEKCYLNNRFVINFLECCPDLRSFTAKRVEFIKNDYEIQSVVHSRPLKFLHMCNCKGDYNSVFEYLVNSELHEMTTLILEDTYYITPEVLKKAFLNTMEANLYRLDISGPPLDTQMMLSLLNKLYADNNMDVKINVSGKHVSDESLLSIPDHITQRITSLSIPDVIFEAKNDSKFITFLKKLDKDKVKKLQINFGSNGPTRLVFSLLKQFKNLEYLYVTGDMTNYTSKGWDDSFKLFVEELIFDLPHLQLLYLSCSSWCKYSVLEVEQLKRRVRNLGRSAPKLVLPFDNVRTEYKMRKEEPSTTNSCLLQ